MRLLIAILILFAPVLAHAELKKGESVDGSPSPVEYENFDSFYNLYQPYMTSIAAYEPIYFLVGTAPEKSKFQFSFKYRLFNRKGPLARNYPWVQGLHFGYTQTSFWDLESDSLPFKDTSYKPELFHLTRNFITQSSWLQGLFIQSGFQHESNGQGESLSRSTNYVYVRPIFVVYSGENKLGVGIAPKIWLYYDNDSDNADLPDYRGNFELNFIIGKADGVVLSSGWRWAEEGGSVQLDLSYPVGQYLSDNVNIYLHIQYANALAESLVNYTERTESLRIGISFVR